MAARATAFLADARELLVPDLVVAELVYVLQSYYEAPRELVAESARAVVGFRSVVVSQPELLLRALEVYERHGLDFAEAYLVAQAEASGVAAVASFDRALRRVGSIRLITPGDPSSR
jgi:predicted nucleic-acid-binding protein